MATTDSRTGFRLPWSTDRAASREASADPADESAEMLEAEVADPTAETATGAGEAPAAAVPVAEADEAGGDATPARAEQVPAPAPGPAPRPAASAAAPQPVRGSAVVPAHRPTKFLADLTRAMQAAAEQARTATLDQFRSDGTAVIEQIHARSSTGAVDLRRRADDDVAAIKDWSKAEIARVREETERRVGARREQLEGQLERHAALIEHEIEKVRRRIASFESEMGSFFDNLLQEDDPAVFAARAANLPEAPAFADLEDDALAALLEEPGVGVPAPAAADVAETAAAPEAAAETSAEVAELADAAVGPAGDEAPADLTGDGEDASTDQVEGAVAADEAELPPDREAAIAAIAAAAEAAAALETEPAADATPGDGAAPEPEAADQTADDQPTEAAAEAGDDAGPAPELDPRLAMLGLTPDFAAAEAAAAEAAVSDVEELPEIAGDALAARLSGLVPGEPAPAGTPTATTQLVTTGLVSVASIASFKRHLGRLAGVGHVGVSSGPDGEFVFSVEHDPATSLAELVPTIPGFAARVVGTGEGIIHVSAQDPQD